MLVLNHFVSSFVFQKRQFRPGLLELAQTAGAYFPGAAPGIGVMARCQARGEPAKRHGAALAQPTRQGRFLRRNLGRRGQRLPPCSCSKPLTLCHRRQGPVPIEGASLFDRRSKLAGVALPWFCPIADERVGFDPFGG